MSHRFSPTTLIARSLVLLLLVSGAAFGQAKSFIPVEGATLTTGNVIMSYDGQSAMLDPRHETREANAFFRELLSKD